MKCSYYISFINSLLLLKNLINNFNSPLRITSNSTSVKFNRRQWTHLLQTHHVLPKNYHGHIDWVVYTS